MKPKKHIVLFMLVLFFASCSSTRQMTSESLFNNIWELEYLSEPLIAFDGLFPDKKPQISFNPTLKKVEGNDSCNGYSADYTFSGDKISFGDPGPTTMMYCGEGEKFFLNTIKKISKYNIDKEGKLNLMIDDIPMMRFRKITP